MSRSRLRRRQASGQSLVELSLLLPVLLLMIVGVTDVGLAIHAWDGASGATREAARFGSNGGNDTDSGTVFANSFNIISNGSYANTSFWILRFNTNSAGALNPNNSGDPTAGGCYYQQLRPTAGSPTVCAATAGGGGTPLSRAELQAFLDVAGNAPNQKYVVAQTFHQHPTLFGWFGPTLPMNVWSMQRDVTP